MDANLITTCAVLHTPGPDADQDGRVCIGHCPACHTVVWSDDGPVWTCPADLSKGNPHHAEATVSEQTQRLAGCYSNCADDFGGVCPHDAMPLHSACYEAGRY